MMDASDFLFFYFHFFFWNMAFKRVLIRVMQPSNFYILKSSIVSKGATWVEPNLDPHLKIRLCSANSHYVGPLHLNVFQSQIQGQAQRSLDGTK